VNIETTTTTAWQLITTHQKYFQEKFDSFALKIALAFLDTYICIHMFVGVNRTLIFKFWNGYKKVLVKSYFLKRLPGVGSEPRSSQFLLFSHFSPLYR
jgi:hypothetical protein